MTFADVHYMQIFSNATTLDYLYMVTGSFGSIITGLSLPVMNVLFGRILDSLNEVGKYSTNNHN